MLQAEQLFFGKTMKPCEYNGETPRTLGKSNCVAISAYSNQELELSNIIEPEQIK